MVGITVMDIDMQSDDGCTKERLRVYDGNSTLNSPEFGSFCSQPASGLRIIEGENSQMLLKFTSDGASSTRGFNITYMRLQRNFYCDKDIPIPNRLMAGSTIKYLESPGYPQAYPSNTTMVWSIHQPIYMGHLAIVTEYSTLETTACQNDNACMLWKPYTTFVEMKHLQSYSIQEYTALNSHQTGTEFKGLGSDTIFSQNQYELHQANSYGKSSTWPSMPPSWLLCPICICTAIGVVAIFIRSPRGKESECRLCAQASQSGTPAWIRCTVNGSLPDRRTHSRVLVQRIHKCIIAPCNPDISKEKL
ncbi:hypothetical protein ScPMuIL_016402 [Solemya velum]